MAMVLILIPLLIIVEVWSAPIGPVIFTPHLEEALHINHGLNCVYDCYYSSSYVLVDVFFIVHNKMMD